MGTAVKLQSTCKSPALLVKCRFWFYRSGAGGGALRLFISNQGPVNGETHLSNKNLFTLSRKTEWNRTAFPNIILFTFQNPMHILFMNWENRASGTLQFLEALASVHVQTLGLLCVPFLSSLIYWSRTVNLQQWTQILCLARVWTSGIDLPSGKMKKRGREFQ